MSKFLIYQEAAGYLGDRGIKVSPLTLRTWVSRNRIRHHKIEGRVYFNPADLDNLIEQSVIEPVHSMISKLPTEM